MDKRIEALRAWGCDVDSAMERMLNDEEFYIECLNTIPEDHNFDLLEETLNNRNTKAAFDCAHTLKGVLANLGLTPMFNKIVEIVEPLRAGNCDNLLKNMNELKEMKQKLAAILND